MDVSLLRARLVAAASSPAAAAPADPVPPEAVAAPAGSHAAEGLAPEPLVPAAVLVPIIHGPSPGVLLTKRAGTLSRHAGQVAFPGGRIEASDETVEAAALREAWEEIGLSPADVELAGTLPAFVTGTGFEVHPVLGLLPSGLSYRAEPAEVDAIFTLPMSVLLDPDAPQPRTGELRGETRTFWVWPHPDHEIWGATAAILVALAQRLRAGGTG